MILSMRMRNIALIEELSLEFGEGLHVMTGETGAGIYNLIILTYVLHEV